MQVSNPDRKHLRMLSKMYGMPWQAGERDIRRGQLVSDPGVIYSSWQRIISTKHSGGRRGRLTGRGGRLTGRRRPMREERRKEGKAGRRTWSKSVASSRSASISLLKQHPLLPVAEVDVRWGVDPLTPLPLHLQCQCHSRWNTESSVSTVLQGLGVVHTRKQVFKSHSVCLKSRLSPKDLLSRKSFQPRLPPSNK